MKGAANLRATKTVDSIISGITTPNRIGTRDIAKDCRSLEGESAEVSGSAAYRVSEMPSLPPQADPPSVCSKSQGV